MANISEMIANEMKQKALEFMRELMKIFAQTLQSQSKTAQLNNETETMNHFLKQFNDYFDQNTGKPKDPNAELPFDVSFYNGDTTKEVIRILNKEGIHHMEFTNGKNRFIITDNDERTRKVMNDIRFGEREEIKNKTTCARMSPDAFSERFSSHKVISVDGFTKGQLDLFDRVAKEKKFFYAVSIQDGAYSVTVTKDDYENPKNDLKNLFKNVAVKAGAGIDAQYMDIFNRKQRILATEAMEQVWKKEGKNTNHIYIDEANPTHYIIVSAKTISVHNGDKNYDIIKDDKNDPASFSAQLNAELKQMQDAAQITHSDFIARYQKSPMDADMRMKFACENAELNKLNTSTAMFSTISKKIEKNKDKINQKDVVYNHAVKRLKRVLKLNKKLSKDFPDNETYLRNIENAQKALEQMERIKVSGESIEAINAVKNENNPLIMVTELNTLATLSKGELSIPDFMGEVMKNQIEEQALSDDKNDVLEMLRSSGLSSRQIAQFIENHDARECGIPADMADNFTAVFADACHNLVINEMRPVVTFKEEAIVGDIMPEDISENIRKAVCEKIPNESLFGDVLIIDALEEMKEVSKNFAVEEHSAAIVDFEINDFKIREEFVYDATKSVDGFYKEIFDTHADERDAARGDDDDAR